MDTALQSASPWRAGMGATAMCFVYLVRCRFTDPAREDAWNSWYSGPKIAEMLKKPYFRTCQRFRRVSGNGRDYVALWTLQTPQAFETEEYTSDWGWFEWRAFITDWSRDLFDAGPIPEAAFAVPEGGALHVISFDHTGAADARAAAARIGDDLMWLPSVGLDRHTPLIGLRRLTGDAAAPQQQQIGMQAAVYRPLCAFKTRPS